MKTIDNIPDAGIGAHVAGTIDIPCGTSRHAVSASLKSAPASPMRQSGMSRRRYHQKAEPKWRRFDMKKGNGEQSHSVTWPGSG